MSIYFIKPHINKLFYIISSFLQTVSTITHAGIKKSVDYFPVLKFDQASRVRICFIKFKHALYKYVYTSAFYHLILNLFQNQIIFLPLTIIFTICDNIC